VRPMMTSASPGRDGGDGDGAGRAQRGTRSSTTIAKFRSTDSGGACPALTIFAVVTRAREVGRAMPTDLLGPPGRCSGCWPHDGNVS
jgi:hypothetical protein